ncbi:hypothetical protein ACMAZE_01340 [Pseudopelagicola sp. nBUS_20]|uniref:hypothetical protein n=1 Tax=Pseudopelagicola sp. nBUS_20 TaxID=3395317 RepID=UPI003EBAAF03
MLRHICTFAVFCLVTPAYAQTCPPVLGDPMAGFTPLDPMMYLDLPDGDLVSVTGPIEAAITGQILAGSALYASKTWCQIGVQRMVVDFEVPIEDDAIAATRTRAVYVWDHSGDPVGWRIDQLGTRPVCARGDDPYALLCP